MPPLPVGAAKRRRLEALQAPSLPSGSEWDSASSRSESQDEDGDMEVEGEAEEEEAALPTSGAKGKRGSGGQPGSKDHSARAPLFTAAEDEVLQAARREIEAELVKRKRRRWKGGKWPEILRRMQQLGHASGRTANQCQKRTAYLDRAKRSGRPSVDAEQSSGSGSGNVPSNKAPAPPTHERQRMTFRWTADEKTALQEAHQSVLDDMQERGLKQWPGGKWPEVQRRLEQRGVAGRTADQCQARHAKSPFKEHKQATERRQAAGKQQRQHQWRTESAIDGDGSQRTGATAVRRRPAIIPTSVGCHVLTAARWNRTR